MARHPCRGAGPSVPRDLRELRVALSTCAHRGRSGTRQGDSAHDSETDLDVLERVIVDDRRGDPGLRAGAAADAGLHDCRGRQCCCEREDAASR